MLQETWLESKNESRFIDSLDRDFKWKAKAAVRIKTRGRAKGGILVGIRKKLSKNVDIEEWDYVLIIKNVKMGKEKIGNIIVTYVSEAVDKMINSIQSWIDEEEKKGQSLLIVGDLNARIGEEQGGEGLRERVSMDKAINVQGEKLLKFCEEKGLEVKNGRTEGDFRGELTFIGEGASTVIDYIIEKVWEEGELVDKLIVESRTESDHLPVTFRIRNGRGRVRLERERDRNIIRIPILKWDETKKQEYREEINGIESSWGENEQVGWEKGWEELTKNIWGTGEKLKMVEKRGSKKYYNWEYGGEAKRQKNLV